MIKKIFKTTLISILCGLVLIILFAVVSIVPVDRTPYYKQGFYDIMQSSLDSVNKLQMPEPAGSLTTGYAKVNLTPSYRTATAGYAKRKGALFSYVHDSIYVRTMVVNNGSTSVALVTADLLLIPPTVTEKLPSRLPEGFDLNNTYLSATHTHNSVGNWGKGLVGTLYSGPYDDSLVNFMADKIAQSIKLASKNLMPSQLYFGTVPVSGAVYNRLAGDEGVVDSLLRVIEVRRNDSTRLLLTSFTAHATCLYGKDLELSRDYPGKLVDELEASGYTFAMFMAGAVGSHGCKGPQDGWERIDYLGEHIAHTFLDHPEIMRPVKDSSLLMLNVPLALGSPQVKVLKDWRVRPWLYRTFIGEYPSFLTVLRIGDVVLLGTPCDFSGELMPPVDSAAAAHDMEAMVTSFNGGYIGYITLDKRYDRDHYETRLMNWYGPGNGAYFTESMIRMIEAVSDKHQ